MMKLLRRLAPIVGVLAALVTGAFLWALLAGGTDCADPACARQRFSLDIELDRFDRVDPIALEVPVEDDAVSVASVLGSGGIEVRIRANERVLPFAAKSGKLDRADLYAFAQAWRGSAPQAEADAQLYAMLTPAIVSDTGEDLFGLMFDATDREGFAIAPGEIAARFQERQADSIPLLQLRTFIHELLHALNRSHGEAAQMPDERLTIEAPTRCISDNTRELNWSLRERPLMALSPQTIRFFQSARPGDVLPGRESAPFLFGSPSTCRDLRATIVAEPQSSRWRFAMRRLKSLVGISAAEAATDDGESKPPDVALAVQALPAAYPLGYPVAIRITATNRGERTLPLAGRLSPGYGIVRIEVRGAPGAPWSVVQPIAWYEPIDDDEAMLAPGERTEQTVPIFFDAEAWTFPTAGAYEVRVRLHLGDDVEDVVTEPMPIRIETPQSNRDREALQLLTDEKGALRDDLGRALLLGGRTREADADAIVDRLATEFRETALGEAVQLTRASRLLRRPIDPRTGERAPPDLAGARTLLADSCSDSGVVALRRQLLDFHEDTGGAPTAASEPVEVAWDGSVPGRSPQIATYSDPSLQQVPQSLHFCHGESRFRGSVAGAAANLARELRRANADRIVVVGHADQTGTCSYNSALALRRAEAVREVLIEAGIPRRRIQVVSLGKRRPLDFSATEEAHRLNRRVEILVPEAALGKLKPREPVLPRCPAPAS
ncbi:outer membrane protein OmpA-like peptidoglycan-associated protein [Povalibacter uvarum]|uniref:Outer membrane protein OmpA-like peptidoglycan-associated protein n=1 Tax=Povalibacter uvarum TaxID=732238 RepID=A0A841HSM2_9GAMM|nr:OmpA family protein [Povalibacter uvarum]MBB6095886.1 outer membrane protein OmpA-like peptidoglycan-associated protein [Povalibacter uvarum]